MNQADNKFKKDNEDVLSSIGNAASQINHFLTNVREKLTDEQRAELDKELASSGGFNEKMNKVSADLGKALQDFNKFNTFGK